MCFVRNYIEVESEEEVIRGVQCSKPHMISGRSDWLPDL